jgi:hypothetical protein
MLCFLNYIEISTSNYQSILIHCNQPQNLVLGISPHHDPGNSTHCLCLCLFFILHTFSDISFPFTFQLFSEESLPQSYIPVCLFAVRSLKARIVIVAFRSLIELLVSLMHSFMLHIPSLKYLILFV